MTINVEYALMAGASYISTRPDVNKFAVPVGWAERTDKRESNPTSGFEATYFTKGSEIVISYAGTDPSDKWGDIAADLALAAGLLSDQLRQAADYYLAVKASAPTGTTITFTGHSLGGGLASLMAVMFGESAVTFDQAPFLNSARTFVDTDFDGNQTSRSVAQRLSAYLGDRAPAALLAYIAANDPLGSNPNSADTLAVRSGRVSNINVDGEFLTSWYLVPSSNRIGSQSNIANSNAGVGGIDLHSQALLAALLQSEQTATTVAGQKQSLSEVTFKLTELLKMIYDKNLFAYPADNSNTRNPNFLELIVNHQAGRNPWSSASIAPDAMVTRFTRDLWKIAQDDGLTLTNNFVAKALTAFAMQAYYEDTDNAKNATKELFTELEGGGGIRFDMADVAKAFKTAFDQGKGLDLDDAKGAVHVRNYIETAFSEGERQLIDSLLPLLRDWYIQAGTDALNTADTQNRNAFLLGGTGDDGLVGGSGVDLLIGNGGADLLQGKAGNDFLLGGKGEDTYVYMTGDGLDTILDTEGQNTLAVDGDILDGGTQYGDALVHRSSDGKHLYVRVAADTLLIDGNIVIRDYASGGSFGLIMTDAATDENPQTTREITGDIKPDDTNAAQAGIQAVRDAEGRLVGTAQPYEDILVGTSANEHIRSGELDDNIGGRGGNDWIETGAGKDHVYGNEGKDLIEGGAGGDILAGDDDDDRIYANTRIDTADAIANGREDTASGEKGDWLAGNAGDDILVAGADNDVLTGGAGEDLLIAGAGDDFILGDADYTPQFIFEDSWRYSEGGNDYWYHTTSAPFEWSVTPQETTYLFEPVTGEQDPENAGVDVIYAGAGKDYAWGGTGNDVLFGENDDDSLYGEDGNDILLGGAGMDSLYGDGDGEAQEIPGNDYLDGGDDIDHIWGLGGDDIIIGGEGDDVIDGGAGRDTYIFNQGDGVDEIWDEDSGPEKSVLIFGEGFDKDSIKLRTGSLLLDMGNGDAIHIEYFDQVNPLATQTFASFQFADGSSLGWEGLLARGFDIDGTDGDDTPLMGTGVDDRIDGRGGDDFIHGLDGNDVITGGLGTDGMAGGLGDDIYMLKAGDGLVGRTADDLPLLELVLDDGGDDTIRFAADILPASLNLTADAYGCLTIDYGSDDVVTIADGLAGAIEHYRVDAGDTARNLSYTQFIGEFGNGLYAGTDAEGHWHLSGGKTNDSLYSAIGGATVSGGRGTDMLRVYGTANTIRYSVGDGTDLVETRGGADTGNVLILSGATAEDLVLHMGLTRQLALRVGTDAADMILFSTFNPADVFASQPFDRVEFAPSTSSGQSGITLSYGALMARGFEVTGTTGGDVLGGTSVTDRIAGGAGDDLLMGGAGNDSYRFNAGDGLDVLQDDVGLNVVEFGAGLTVAGMSVAQSRAEDGQRYLDLDFGNGDRLSVMDGELARVSSFAFADGTTLSTTQLLALLPAVNLRGADASEAFSGFGGDDLIDGGAGNDVVTGGDGADRLYGGMGNDLLQGDAGADVLDGGAGNDTLNGGGGVDTYRFGAGMGQDTVLETGGEASVLDLMAGTTMVTMTARQEGDDLLLATRVGNDALRISGYYADPNAETNWTVKTADGVVRDMSAFLQGMGNRAATGSQFIAEFRERWVSGWNAWHVNDGYTVGADGVARRSQTSMSTSGTSTWLHSKTESCTLAVEDYETGNGEDTYGTWYGFPYRYEHSFTWPELRSETYQSSVTTTSSAIRQAVLSSRTALDPWDQPVSEIPSEPFFIPAQAGLRVSGFRLPEGATTMIVENPDGSLKGTWVYPAASPVPPQPGEQTITVQKEVIDIATIYTTPISFLGAGDDAVAGLNLDGGSGNDLLAIDSDELYAFSRMNLPVFLYGNEGNDWLRIAGESEGIVEGEAIMIGGSGRDRLEGAAGRNVFMLLEEDSIDTIMDREAPRYGSPLATDEVIFGPGVTAESLRVLCVSSDVSLPWNYQDSRFLQLLTPDGTGARIQIAGANDPLGTGIELVSFSDGARLTVSQLLARLNDSQIVMGSTWNDTLLLGAGNDVIDGGQGNDVLVGAAGNDIYRFGRGGGQDVIDQTNAVATDLDVLRFSDDVLPSDIAVYRDERNLYFEIADSGDLAVVESFYEGNLHRLSAVEFADSTVWAGSQFELDVPSKFNGNLGTTDCGIGYFGTDGDDELRGLGDSVQLFGGAGDDTLYAGSGARVLTGGAGNDRYVFGRGDGAEWIFRDSGGGYHNDGDYGDYTLRDVAAVIDQSDADDADMDYIRMEYGVASADVIVARARDDLVLTIVDTDDRLVLQDWLVSPSNRVRGVQFADGTVWNQANLEEMAPLPKIVGTNADDVLLGTSAAESIQGLAGNDEIHGFDGSDRLEGGAGDDLVAGGQGSDVFLFGRNDGHDVIDQSDAGPDDEDVVRLKAGIDPTDVLLERNGGGLRLTIGGTEDSIQISGAGVGMLISRVEFADGTVWASALLEAAPFSIVGSEDSDYLEGSEGDDVVRGLGEDDLLAGSYGNDVLIGGAGDDELMGGAGNDVYWFGRGDGHDLIYTDGEDGHAPENLDVIRFGDNVVPEDVGVFFGPYDLVLFIADTGDSIAIEEWQSSWGVGISRIEFGNGTFWDEETLLGMSMEIIGTDDGDDLFGTRRGNLMMGLAGDDYLDGKGGDDTLTGGLGDDWLEGGAGNDVYVISPDDGYDQIFEHSSGPESIPTEISTIRFEQGIAPEDVEIGRGEYGELVFSIQQGYGQVSFDAYPGAAVQVEFSDGTLWGQEIFAAAGENLALGTNEFPLITGSGGNDFLETASSIYAEIFGLAGDDVLVGDDGDSYLVGGAGNDTLAGGAGEDRYFMDAFSGYDVIAEAPDGGDDWDSIEFGRSITQDQLRFDRYAGDGSDLLVSIVGTTASVLVDDWFASVASSSIEGFYFLNDESEWGSGGIDAAIWANNEAPVFVAENLEAWTGEAFSHSLGESMLTDPDGDRLSYSATLADSGALPAWLDFDTETGVLSGTPDGSDIGSLEIFVTGLDAGGESTSGSLTVTVAAPVPSNSAPVVANALANRVGSEDLAISFVVPVDTFADDDAGDTLAMSATLMDGSALPVWLTFDTATGTFSGTPSAGDNGVVGLRVTATDRGGLSAQAEFSLAIGQHLRGTAGSDTLNYSASTFVGVPLIDGGAGNDVITGSSGDDIIVGGSGTDNLNGGDGDDTFLLSGADAGYDRFEGGAGYDVLRGSAGDDTFRMYNFSGAVTVERIDGNGGHDILAGTGSSDTLDFSGTELVGIAMIDGGAGNDAITGSAGNDLIVGGAGTDNLNGGDGDDAFLIAGTDAGYDRFEGGAGYDVIQGSAGDDTIRMYNFSGTATVEKIDGNGGHDILAGTGSSDTLDFSGTELVGIAMIDGGAGNDAIT
ncbi:MAG: putative Ig domain-containing protein, partial [Sulfuritalea sp.]|nr:putative Ig domain-containing protein [Sulfuritalea sp.]